ncbi:MAG TPA: 1,4-dihydroxy-2-naphthoate octaprenyltransferase [Casimicrobiaceae bacterium]|nr:1,4-dihydroxy-2-naphthoate octaprenyltransferase [Casimicrobiaceae bacterium]
MPAGLDLTRLFVDPQPSQVPDVVAGSVPDVRAGSLRAWLVVVRPRSLLVAISPVLVGAAMGYARTSDVDAAATLLVLVAAVLVQAISNMQNDVGYTLRGAERRGGRRGLPRATAHGWLRVEDVRAAIVVASIAATAVGVLLVVQHGPWVLLIGTLSLLAALAYMAGPRPIAYTPFGEATVFVFFGLVAVLGTDWVVTGSIGAITVIAAVAMGCLAAAALCVNNHRDVGHDRAVGRRTFAVVFGPVVSRRLYAVLLATPFLLLPALAIVAPSSTTMSRAAPPFSTIFLLPMLLTPVAWSVFRDFSHCAPGTAFNAILFRTFKLELAFAVLLATSAVLSRNVPA